MKESRIKVENISKSFSFPVENRNTFKSFFLNPFKKVPVHTFTAVKGINFEVFDGEFVGIVGRNGSGKSTLLKMLAGIYEPDSGQITVNGKLVPFLELGVGFNPELSAKENIFLNGTILGLTHKQIKKKFDEIVEFAEIGEFIDLQLKNFSSGMTVRLAFSIAIHVPAEIYLLDEVLAVGDINFQKKCITVFEEFRRKGKTIILVSHDLKSVERFCNRAILINEHQLVSEGQPAKIVAQYQEIMSAIK